jgi:prefoldin subunit 5
LEESKKREVPGTAIDSYKKEIRSLKDLDERQRKTIKLKHKTIEEYRAQLRSKD